MGDDWGLEDKFLRQNIPGRYSQWERDSDEEAGRPEEEEEEEEDDDDEAETRCGDIEDDNPGERAVPEALRYGDAPGRQRGGVKGQLAQYRHFKTMEYHAKLAAKAERDALLLRAALGATRSPDDPAPPGQTGGRGGGRDDDDDDDEDEGFMRAYRERRLRELRRDAGKPRFGALRASVSTEGFVQAISTTDARVPVVVHLHEPTYQPSRRLEALVAVLARRRVDVLFVSMTLDEAGEVFDPDVLPILAVYRGGDLINTLFRVTNRLDARTEDSDLEELLDATAAFQPRDDAESAAAASLQQPVVARYHDEEETRAVRGEEDAVYRTS